MGVYAQALAAAPKGTLADLQGTYAAAESVAIKQCGAGYAQATAVVGATANTARSVCAGRGGWGVWAGGVVGVGVLWAGL